VTYDAGTGSLVQYNASTGALVNTIFSGFSPNGPRSPVFGPDGSMYVPDWQTHNIWKLSPSGSTYAAPTAPFITDPALTPDAVIFAPDGSLLAINDPCCSGPDSVRRYDPTSGTLLSTLVSTGSGGLARGFSIVLTPGGPSTPALGGLAPLLGASLAAFALLAMRRRAPSA
jgi:hypothetical protein